ncbi:MAG: hypothetical protein M3065_17590 [Actinomycetota bacterium]|nr:hypothetical protein [Actinomycetota bacterium]
MLRRTLVAGSVVALATAAGASAASPGLYMGKTSQKQTISVQVTGGKVVKVVYFAKYGACGDFSGQDKVAITIKNNKFSATVHPNSETVDQVSGTFKGKAVSGTLSSTVITGGLHGSVCHSGKLKFSAKL